MPVLAYIHLLNVSKLAKKTSFPLFQCNTLNVFWVIVDPQ